MNRPGQRIYLSSVILVAIAGLLPAAPRAEETEVLVDLPYVHSAAEEQHLDFYWPSDGADETLLFIQGRSLPPFVDAGVACATMDYRLHPTHKWPAMPGRPPSASGTCSTTTLAMPHSTAHPKTGSPPCHRSTSANTCRRH